jgi:hypothetical protein
MGFTIDPAARALDLPDRVVRFRPRVVRVAFGEERFKPVLGGTALQESLRTHALIDGFRLIPYVDRKKNFVGGCSESTVISSYCLSRRPAWIEACRSLTLAGGPAYHAETLYPLYGFKFTLGKRDHASDP